MGWLWLAEAQSQPPEWAVSTSCGADATPDSNACTGPGTRAWQGHRPHTWSVTRAPGVPVGVQG